LIRRKPLQITTFENIQQAQKYSEKTAKQLERISKSFVHMIKRMGVTSGRVLDIGTGSGTLAIGLCKEIPNISATGLDISNLILTFAQENAEKNNLSSRVTFIEGNAEEMLFEDNSFDLIVSSNTLHLIENPLKMFNEMERVLKSEGKFFISDFKRNFLGLISGHIKSAYNSKEIEKILNQSQLKKWKIQNYFFWINILSEGD